MYFDNNTKNITILGAFATLWKATISFAMSAHHRMDFHKILFQYFFENVGKIQFSLNSDKNNSWYYMNSYLHLWEYLAAKS
jgi:hypothetical protein